MCCRKGVIQMFDAEDFEEEWKRYRNAVISEAVLKSVGDVGGLDAAGAVEAAVEASESVCLTMICVYHDMLAKEAAR